MQPQKQNNYTKPDQIITESLLNTLKKIIGDKSTIQSTAIVKLFTASQNSFFEYSGLTGLLCLVWDREREAPFFRMFNPETLLLVFECELYVGFDKSYSKVNELFYYFELIRGYVGLSFAFECQAKTMQLQIQSASSQLQDNYNINHNAQKEQNCQEQKKELFGFRRGFKKIFGKSKNKDNEGQPSNIIQPYLEDQKVFVSKPSDNPVQAQVRLENSGTLDISNMDDKMKKIFTDAGITEQELKDKDYAPYIFDALVIFNDNIQDFMSKNDNEKQEKIKIQQNIQKQQQQQQKQQQQQQNQSQPQTQQQTSQNTPQETEKPQHQPLQQQSQQNTPPPPPPPPAIDLSLNNKPQTQNTSVPQAPSINLNTNNNNNQNNPPQPPSLVNILAQETQKPDLNQNQNSKIKQELNSKVQESNQNVEDRSNLLDQIRSGNFNLKKASERKQEQQQNQEIKVETQNEQQNLTQYLAQAISKRRNQLQNQNESSSDQKSSSQFNYTSSDQYTD